MREQPNPGERMQPITLKKSTENKKWEKTPNWKKSEKETEQWKTNKKTNMLIHKRITERWKCGTLFMKMRRTEGPDSGGVAA